MFDWKKPTTMLLGRWQPWHDGHTELFLRALAETGQVCIMIRDVGGIVGEDAGAGRTAAQTDNPFDMEVVKANIITALAKQGYEFHNYPITVFFFFVNLLINSCPNFFTQKMTKLPFLSYIFFKKRNTKIVFSCLN